MIVALTIVILALPTFAIAWIGTTNNADHLYRLHLSIFGLPGRSVLSLTARPHRSSVQSFTLAVNTRRIRNTQRYGVVNAEQNDMNYTTYDSESVANWITEQTEPWRLISTVTTISSPWLTLRCERWRDNPSTTHTQSPLQEDLDYWRVEKDHSLIVLTLQNNALVFPRPQYRVGLQRPTLDFCGGRVAPLTRSDLGNHYRDTALRILRRELGVEQSDLQSMTCMNQFRESHKGGSEETNSLTTTGWPVNSSFSNQELFGFVVVLKDSAELDEAMTFPFRYDLDDIARMQGLLHDSLTCLQCRSILLEFLWNRQLGYRSNDT
jgi:hypothetical protein